MKRRITVLSYPAGLLVVAAVVVAAVPTAAGVIHQDLQPILRQAPPDQPVSVLVYLRDQVDLAAVSASLDRELAAKRRRHEVVVRTLQENARRTQRGLIAELTRLQAAGQVRDFEAFWIANIIRVEAPPAVIARLAQRPDVGTIYLNYPIEPIEPVGPVQPDPDDGERNAGPRAPEPGLVAIRAPEVWNMGITGEGVLVANIDTGVDGTHPALASRWAGVADPRYQGHPEWAWFDPFRGQNDFPYDEGGHGTHTMGTVCGGPPGDEIGVAPGAYWIAAGAIDRGGGIDRTVADAIRSFEWMTDPDGDPSTVWDVPDVCSNSWGLADVHGYPDCDQTFWSFIDASEAAGTVQLFSAGNEGTDGLRRPADRATDEYNTLAVGAVDANQPGWPIAGFSSRGPTFCTPDGSPATKPDMAAPGVSVRSALPGNRYGSLSGTSMASPHINGVCALMLQANPELTVQDVKQILYDTAVDLGSTGEDNAYGHGMVDAFEAVTRALELATLRFDYPDGRPDLIDPRGGTRFRVEITGINSEPQPGTGRLHYSVNGGPFTDIPMEEITDNVYDAVFPPVECGATVDYYLSVETTDGEIVTSPFNAPDSTFSAFAAVGFPELFSDNFETDTGWTVENQNVIEGGWERGFPLGGGDRGDPPSDWDGSGRLYETGTADGIDLDGGPTILTSPRLSAPDGGTLHYARWFYNDDGDDTFLAEISGDDGNTWVTLESITGGGGNWVERSFEIADFITPSDQIRVRFTVADQPNNSVTEAAIDAVRITTIDCGTVPGDFDGDGDVDVADFSFFSACFTGSGIACSGDCCDADLDGDGDVDIADFAIFSENYTGSQ